MPISPLELILLRLSYSRYPLLPLKLYLKFGYFGELFSSLIVNFVCLRCWLAYYISHSFWWVVLDDIYKSFTTIQVIICLINAGLFSKFSSSISPVSIYLSTKWGTSQVISWVLTVWYLPLYSDISRLQRQRLNCTPNPQRFCFII